MSHLDEELLSAAIDAELDPTERARVERHLVACPECAEARAALQFARDAVRGLGDPVMPELHRKQLWREINRARRAPATRWRALVAVAGTAAAIGAFAALTSLGTSSGPNVLARDVTVVHQERDWREDDLGALVGMRAAQYNADAGAPSESVPSAMAPMAGSPLPTPEPGPGEDKPGDDLDATSESDGKALTAGGRASAAENHGARIAQCETVVRPGGGDGAIAVRYIVATYDGLPAYILVYDVPRDRPSRREVFAVQRSDCRVLAHRSSA